MARIRLHLNQNNHHYSEFFSNSRYCPLRGSWRLLEALRSSGLCDACRYSFPSLEVYIKPSCTKGGGPTIYTSERLKATKIKLTIQQFTSRSRGNAAAQTMRGR